MNTNTINKKQGVSGQCHGPEDGLGLLSMFGCLSNVPFMCQHNWPQHQKVIQSMINTSDAMPDP